MVLMKTVTIKHPVIIPIVADSDEPVDEKINDFIQKKCSAWSRVGHTQWCQKLMRGSKSVKKNH